ncbi:MAG: GNAT family N-acetyltransferase [Bacteroidota bacterium]
MQPITLTTERLHLRQFCADDLDDFAGMNADPEVMRFYPAPLSRQQSNDFLDTNAQHWLRHGFGLFAVTDRESCSFLGYTGLKVPQFEAFFTPCVEIGWRFTTASWGKGYATEAARACLEFGFTTIGLSQIASFTTIRNVRSEQVMIRLGMHRIGDFENPRVEPGHPLRPHVLYAIDRN